MTVGHDGSGRRPGPGTLAPRYPICPPKPCHQARFGSRPGKHTPADISCETKNRGRHCPQAPSAQLHPRPPAQLAPGPVAPRAPSEPLLGTALGPRRPAAPSARPVRPPAQRHPPLPVGDATYGKNKKDRHHCLQSGTKPRIRHCPTLVCQQTTRLGTSSTLYTKRTLSRRRP